MQLISTLNKIISCIILTLSTFYVWSKLTNKRINLKNYRPYLSLVIIVLVSISNYYIVNQYLRISMVTIVLAINFWFVFRENLQKSIVTPIFSQLLTMIVEMIFVVTISLIFDMDNQGIINTQFGQFFSNLIISILLVLVVNIPIVKKLYKGLIKITDKISHYQLLLFSLLIIVIANMLTMILYYKVEFRYLLIFNTLLTVFCFSIVLYSFRTKNNYNKVYDKYNTTLNSLKEYEDILDKYRISNHENKNQLLTIRNMLPKTSKKAIDYIDTVVENKLKDNERAMVEAAKIPAGGLRGLIYSKILVMKDGNINYKLEISSEIKTVNLINDIDDSTMLDVCKVVGVYLDNAIQAVEQITEKYVSIKMYLEDGNLVISISNNYKGTIDLDLIESKGYTSKGKNHGYGLSLAKDIIASNKKLSNEKSITKDIFTQILKIKM